MVMWCLVVAYLIGYIFEFQSCYNSAKQEINGDKHEPLIVAGIVALGWPFLVLGAVVLGMIDGVKK